MNTKLPFVVAHKGLCVDVREEHGLPYPVVTIQDPENRLYWYGVAFLVNGELRIWKRRRVLLEKRGWLPVIVEALRTNGYLR